MTKTNCEGAGRRIQIRQHAKRGACPVCQRSVSFQTSPTYRNRRWSNRIPEHYPRGGPEWLKEHGNA